MPKDSKSVPAYRRTLVNVFGAFAYISCLMQWLWTAVIFLPALIATGWLDSLMPQETTTTAPMFTFQAPPVVVWIVLAITAGIMALSIIVLIRLPGEIAKAGKRVTRTTATAALPAVTHHKKLTPKKKLQITYRLILGIKLILIFVPFVALLAVYFIPADIPAHLVIVAGGFCATMSLLWLAAQNGLAYLWRIPTDQLL